MATRLYLVRHGATQLTAEDRFSGATGADLSDEGHDQVRRLAERLSRHHISAIYCSPFARAAETARVLAEPHRLTLERRDGLREISHGHWEGLTRREVEERYAEESRRFICAGSPSRSECPDRSTRCALRRKDCRTGPSHTPE